MIQYKAASYKGTWCNNLVGRFILCAVLHKRAWGTLLSQLAGGLTEASVKKRTRQELEWGNPLITHTHTHTNGVNRIVPKLLLSTVFDPFHNVWPHLTGQPVSVFLKMEHDFYKHDPERQLLTRHHCSQQGLAGLHPRTVHVACCPTLGGVQSKSE